MSVYVENKIRALAQSPLTESSIYRKLFTILGLEMRNKTKMDEKLFSFLLVLFLRKKKKRKIKRKRLKVKKQNKTKTIWRRLLTQSMLKGIVYNSNKA